MGMTRPEVLGSEVSRVTVGLYRTPLYVAVCHHHILSFRVLTAPFFLITVAGCRMDRYEGGKEGKGKKSVCVWRGEQL